MPSKYATTSNMRYIEKMRYDVITSEGLPSLIAWLLLSSRDCSIPRPNVRCSNCEDSPRYHCDVLSCVIITIDYSACVST